MTIQLDLTPHTESWLNAEARQHDLHLEQLVQRVLEERASLAVIPSRYATPQERIRAMDALAEKNADLPILSDSAFDRETIYEDSL